jgi:hypothetical protein
MVVMVVAFIFWGRLVACAGEEIAHCETKARTFLHFVRFFFRRGFSGGGEAVGGVTGAGFFFDEAKAPCEGQELAGAAVYGIPGWEFVDEMIVGNGGDDFLDGVPPAGLDVGDEGDHGIVEGMLGRGREEVRTHGGGGAGGGRGGGAGGRAGAQEGGGRHGGAVCGGAGGNELAEEREKLILHGKGAAAANGGENLAENPILKGLRLGLATAKNQPIQGRLGNECHELIPAGGGRFHVAHIARREIRHVFAMIADFEDAAEIPKGKPRFVSLAKRTEGKIRGGLDEDDFGGRRGCQCCRCHWFVFGVKIQG